jgi:hypothetical protein
VSGWLVIGAGGRLRGGRFDADLVPEGFEFADEPACAGVGVVEVAGEVVRAQVAVGGGLGQRMPDDHNEGVGGGNRGLRPAFLAEAAVEAAELGAEVGAGALGRPGAFGEDRAELGVALAGLARAVPSGGFVVTRALAGPRRQVRRGREPGHLDADLGDD